MRGYGLSAFALLLFAQAAHPAAVSLEVPFVSQPPDGCGAASIAMVIGYWSHHSHRPAADVQAIHQQLYSPQARGVFASAMERYFQQNGFQAYAFRAEWNDIENHLRKGRPLIVALQPGRGPLHYVVVTGFDAQHVLLHDPAVRQFVKQRRSTFESQWRRARFWTLLAVPASAP